MAKSGKGSKTHRLAIGVTLTRILPVGKSNIQNFVSKKTLKQKEKEPKSYRLNQGKIEDNEFMEQFEFVVKTRAHKANTDPPQSMGKIPKTKYTKIEEKRRESILKEQNQTYLV